MRILPGSHAEGRLAPTDLNAWISRAPEQAVDCLVPAGGAVLMRPLILHASSAATGPGHRRVVHLEYAAEPLPGGLEGNRLAPAEAMGGRRRPPNPPAPQTGLRSH